MPAIRVRGRRDVVRRLEHALVFVRNPPSADIFRQDQFLDKDGVFQEGAVRRAQKKSWKTPLECVILKIGKFFIPVK